MKLFLLRDENDLQNFALHGLFSAGLPLLGFFVLRGLGVKLGVLGAVLFWLIHEMLFDGHLGRILTGKQTKFWWFDWWTDTFSQLAPAFAVLLAHHLMKAGG
jgi:hypothetical protein